MTLFQAMTSLSVDCAIQQLSGPMEIDCPAAASDLANLGPGMSTLSTNDTPSMTGDHQAEGSDKTVLAATSEDTLSGLTPTCHQLCLGNGTILNFTKEEVGDPPAISFANDIPCLIQIWDDTLDEWNPHKCVLHIQGHPIALVYWRDVYIYGKKGQWKGIQNRWTDWQVCILFINLTLTLTELGFSVFFF
jgi:hypothetical protein